MRITFANFTLDVATRQLLEGTDEVRLSPKAFELLHVLLENRTRAVSKAELHERLWEDSYVTDANLAVLVAEIRHALHDRPATPRFIRTVRGFGYGFCGNVGSLSEPAPASRHCWIVMGHREIALRDGDNIIGRDPGATVRLDRPSVSRRHARIVVSADEVSLADLGSKNGTFLGQNRITQAVALADLDEVYVGAARLLVRIMSGDATTETLAELSPSA